MAAFKSVKKFFSGEDEIPEVTQEGYVEVNVMDSLRSATGGKLSIKIDKLNDFADADRILRHVREGSVVFLRIKGLKEKDMGELKRTVEKLKKTVTASNGDIVGVEQDWLILTPAYAAVQR
jgi:SepF-like predicted cell division protein (DUF552 family)